MPSGASLSFNDPYQYQERIRPADVHIIPRTRGDFRATLSQMTLHQLTLQQGWQSLPAMARATLHKSRSSIIFHTRAEPSSIKVDGIDLISDGLVLAAPAEEHFIQTSSEWSWASLTVTPETYAAARVALIGDDFNPAMRTSMARPPSASMDRLRVLHRRALGLISAASDHDTHPEAARGMEQSLLATVIDCLAGEANNVDLRLGTRNSTAAIRKLYELLDASEGLPLYLIDVCARLGVSRRTLHAACVEHLGLGPHRFLWLRRMHLARQALIATDPRAATVTQIATSLGFWELGRFSVHYKWLFAESPSATLGARRGARLPAG